MAAPVLTWYLCDLVTGTVLADALPITTDQVVSNLLQENQANFTLSVMDPACPSNWAELFTPVSRMLVLTVDGSPAQAWWLNAPERGAEQVPLTGTTREGCASAYPTPTSVIGTFDDATAVANMCTSTVTWNGATGTFAIASLATAYGFTVEPVLTGKTSDYDTSSSTDTLLASLQKVMYTDGTVEVRFGVRWTDNTQRAFTKVISIGPKIGAYRPDARLDLDANGVGSVTSYRVTPAQRGATVVLASTSAGTLLSADPQYANDLLVPLSSGGPGFPTVVLAKSYDNLANTANITTALTSRAKATLASYRTGVATWTFTLSTDSLFPGRDFDDGDTVDYLIAAQPHDPLGGVGQMRMVGWSWDVRGNVVSPTAWPDPNAS